MKKIYWISLGIFILLVGVTTAYFVWDNDDPLCLSEDRLPLYQEGKLIGYTDANSKVSFFFTESGTLIYAEGDEIKRGEFCN